MKGTKPHLVVGNDTVRDAPPAPGWLSKDAKLEWLRVIKGLVDRRILTKPDLGGLENYCVAMGQVREMEAHIQEHGAIYEAFREDKDGNLVSLGMKRNPAVGVQSDAMTRAQRLAAELGLTPVSRSRPTVREAGDDDENPSPLDI